MSIISAESVIKGSINCENTPKIWNLLIGWDRNRFKRNQNTEKIQSQLIDGMHHGTDCLHSQSYYA